MIVLQPDDPNDFLQLTGIKLPVRPGLRLPPGRGVLLVDRRPTVVQVVDALGRELVPGIPGREASSSHPALTPGPLTSRRIGASMEMATWIGGES